MLIFLIRCSLIYPEAYDKVVPPTMFNEVEPNDTIESAMELPLCVADINACFKYDFSGEINVNGKISKGDIDYYKTFLSDYRENYVYLISRGNSLEVQILNENGDVVEEFTSNPFGDYICKKIDNLSGNCYIRLSGADKDSEYSLMVGQIIENGYASMKIDGVLTLTRNQPFSETKFFIDKSKFFDVILGKKLPDELTVVSIDINMISSERNGREPYDLETYYSYEGVSNWQKTPYMKYCIDIPPSKSIGFGSLMRLKMQCDEYNIRRDFSLKPTFRIRYLFYVNEENIDCY